MIREESFWLGKRLGVACVAMGGVGRLGREDGECIFFGIYKDEIV